MKGKRKISFLGKFTISLAIIGIFAIVSLVNYERHDPEQDLRLIKSGDLVMCTAEKVSSLNGDKAVLHVIAAMSVMENAVESRKLHGFILNNDAIINGVVGYEELHKNCEGEIIFADAGSQEERNVTSGITTKGLPLEIVYLPPLPTRSF